MNILSIHNHKLEAFLLMAPIQVPIQAAMQIKENIKRTIITPCDMMPWCQQTSHEYVHDLLICIFMTCTFMWYVICYCWFFNKGDTNYNIDIWFDPQEPNTDDIGDKPILALLLIDKSLTIVTVTPPAGCSGVMVLHASHH